MKAVEISGNKGKAVSFLKLVVSGKIEEAYKKYVDMTGRHHNPFFAAGFPSLQKAMIENHGQFPNKKYSVRNVVGDGDLVAVHAHLSFGDGKTEMIVVHVARFENDKIVEFWDCGQAIPADSPNTDGPF